MIYEYKCDKCEVVLEVICSVEDRPKFKKCLKCGGRCEQAISAPAVMRSGMSEAPIDVVIGRDAEKRWKTIKERQEVRNKARQESGKTGLTKVGKDDYKSHDKKLKFVPCTGTEG